MHKNKKNNNLEESGFFFIILFYLHIFIWLLSTVQYINNTGLLLIFNWSGYIYFKISKQYINKTKIKQFEIKTYKKVILVFWKFDFFLNISLTFDLICASLKNSLNLYKLKKSTTTRTQNPTTKILKNMSK